MRRQPIRTARRRALTFTVALVAILLTAPGRPLAAQETVAARPFITYTFENEMFEISRIDMTIDASGRGSLTFVKKGLAQPVRRGVRVLEGTMQSLAQSLEKLDFLASSEVYQSKNDHSNLGTVTLKIESGERSREARFNYTENREMWSLGGTLRGIANREIYAFELETASRYRPLDMPGLLQTLKEEVLRRRVADPLALVPLLRDISGNVGLPLIARNRAAELADQIEKREKP